MLWQKLNDDRQGCRASVLPIGERSKLDGHGLVIRVVSQHFTAHFGVPPGSLITAEWERSAVTANPYCTRTDHSGKLCALLMSLVQTLMPSHSRLDHSSCLYERSQHTAVTPGHELRQLIFVE